MYSTVEELARVLEIRDPTPAQSDALERVLVAATVEIDHEIDLDPDDDEPLSDEELELATQVALQRGAELWGLQEVPLGIVGIGGDLGTSSLARNSWAKYAYTLAAIKRNYGFA
jgi:hypothetical protein